MALEGLKESLLASTQSPRRRSLFSQPELNGLAVTRSVLPPARLLAFRHRCSITIVDEKEQSAL
jgi:hypothetical protein